MYALIAVKLSLVLTTSLSKFLLMLFLGMVINVSRHRRTHEIQADGQPAALSEEDYENEENDFGSMDDLSSPEEPSRSSTLPMTSMPPPSSLIMQPMPQPMLAPSQLIHNM